MLLRKYMSMIGIGSATIDLMLPKQTYRAGEYIKGTFLIKGGIIDQKAKRIECDLIMVHSSTGEEKTMNTLTILTSRVIQAEEIHNLSFSFKIPSSVPASTKERSYRFETKLFFTEGVTSKDQDAIYIVQ
ncbi:sporulation protein [Siminovitchia sediminis]|uniref:Sporulation protein n=1 Tax=Siminovitchia sediminis TaxID=1274353 RepID=A0ABW4KNV7_9BACI